MKKTVDCPNTFKYSFGLKTASEISVMESHHLFSNFQNERLSYTCKVVTVKISFILVTGYYSVGVSGEEAYSVLT